MSAPRVYQSPAQPGRLPKVPAGPAERGVQAIPGTPKPTISDRPADAPPADYDDAPRNDLLTDGGHPMVCGATLPPLAGDHEHVCHEPVQRPEQTDGVPLHRCFTCPCSWTEARRADGQG